jgi:hypothetical protein
MMDIGYIRALRAKEEKEKPKEDQVSIFSGETVSERPLSAPLFDALFMNDNRRRE